LLIKRVGGRGVKGSIKTGHRNINGLDGKVYQEPLRRGSEEKNKDTTTEERHSNGW